MEIHSPKEKESEHPKEQENIIKKKVKPWFLLKVDLKLRAGSKWAKRIDKKKNDLEKKNICLV